MELHNIIKQDGSCETNSTEKTGQKTGLFNNTKQIFYYCFSNLPFPIKAPDSS